MGLAKLVSRLGVLQQVYNKDLMQQAGTDVLCMNAAVFLERCPSLVPAGIVGNFDYECTDDRNVGSICNLSCNAIGQRPIGFSRIRCLNDMTWSTDVNEIRCGKKVL